MEEARIKAILISVLILVFIIMIILILFFEPPEPIDMSIKQNADCRLDCSQKYRDGRLKDIDYPILDCYDNCTERYLYD